MNAGRFVLRGRFVGKIKDSNFYYSALLDIVFILISSMVFMLIII